MRKENNMNTELTAFVDYLNNTMTKPDGYSYRITGNGRKFTRINMNSRGHESVYVFIDNSNGDILKPAGYNGRAKGARGNINDIESYKFADWHGGWLYKMHGNIYS